MMRKNLFGLSAIVALLGLLVACSNVGKTEKSGLLAKVPADTAYVFYAEKALPSALVDKMLESAAVDFEQSSQALKQEFSSNGPKGPGPDLLMAMLDELQGKLSVSGFKSLGFRLGARSVIYGLDGYPVMITEVEDPEKVRQTLQRIEERSGQVAFKGKIDQQPYRRFEIEEFVAVLLVTEEHFIATFIPKEKEIDYLSQVLAERYAGESLADTGDMVKLMDKYAYTGHGEGYVDLRKVSDFVLNLEQQEPSQTHQQLAVPWQKPSAACAALTNKVVNKVPRLVFGTLEAQADAYVAQNVLETAPEVAEHLQHLPAPVPGLGQSDEAVFSMGLSMNTAELRNGLTNIMRFVIDQGQDCEWVDAPKLEQSIPQLAVILNPMMSGIKGLNFTLSGLDADDQGKMVKGLDMALLLAADDPRGFFAMVSAFLPDMAKVQITDDGKAVKLPVENMGKDVPPIYAAMQGRALAFASGKDSEQRLADALVAGLKMPSPILSVGYNMEKIADFLKRLEPALADMDPTDENQALVKEQLMGIGSTETAFRQIRIDVSANQHGLVMDQTMLLK